MEAQQQKQLQAKQSAVVFSQHHHIHLVRVRAAEKEAAEPNQGWKAARLIPSRRLSPPPLPAETREEKRRGAAEEGVGGPGAREDPGQITILQRGQAL